MSQTVNSAAIQSEVSALTLRHMDMKIDIENLLLDDYDTAHIDLAILLTQGYYKRTIKLLGDDAGKKQLNNRALYTAKWFAINRLTTQFKGLIDRTTLFMLADAEESGWYRTDWFGYDDLLGLLSSIADATEEKASEYYDWNFIVGNLLPACQGFGIAPEQLMSASCNIKKLRGIVPAARELLDKNGNGTITDKKAREDIQWMLELASDIDVSYTVMRESIDTYRGKEINRIDPVAGERYILPQGKTLFVIEASSPVEERTIERALVNRVDFKTEDLGLLFSRAKQLRKRGDDE